MLLVRVFRGSDRISTFFIALAGSLVGLWFALPWTQPAELLVSGHVVRQEFFTGMLVYDRLAVYFRGLLMFFAVLFVVLTRLSGIPDREDAPDFYPLVLGATLGMCMMASANHLLTSSWASRWPACRRTRWPACSRGGARAARRR